MRGKNHSRQMAAKKQLYILFIPGTPTSTAFMIVLREVVFLISQRVMEHIPQFPTCLNVAKLISSVHLISILNMKNFARKQ